MDKISFLYIVISNIRFVLALLRIDNHLGGGPVVRAWNQEIYFLYGLRFEPCGCSYNDHWRLTWSLTSGPMGLVEVRAN